MPLFSFSQKFRESNLTHTAQVRSLRTKLNSLFEAVQNAFGELQEFVDITPSDGVFIVGDGTKFVGESGNTSRTSLGLGTGDSPTFAGLEVTGAINGTSQIWGNGGFFQHYHHDADGSMAMSGGSSASLGANLLLYGESHATLAGDFFLRDGSNTLVWYDKSSDDFTTYKDWVFTGDLTVDTDTLYVDSTNDRVGIGTNSPSERMHLSAFAEAARLWIEDTSNGDSAPGGPGLLLTSASMNNIGSDYSASILFGSTDASFTTENPKVLAYIAPYATEGYYADTASGMGLSFWTTPDSAGASPTPSNRVVINQDGYMGVGTASPEAVLHTCVEGSDPVGVMEKIGGSASLRLRRANGTKGALTALTSGNVIGNVNFSGYDGTSYSGGMARVRANATENWSASARGANLDFTTTENGTTGGVVRATISHDGKLGVGVTDPGDMLHVRGADISYTWTPYVFGTVIFEDDVGCVVSLVTGSTYTSEIWFGDESLQSAGRVRYEHPTNRMEFWANNAERAYLTSSVFAVDTDTFYVNTSSDRVGIGTSSPDEILHLASTGSAVLKIEADTDNATESDHARIELSQDGGAVTASFGYDSSQNKLRVMQDYSDDLILGTNGSDRVYIDSSGNVGIGVSSPSQALDVNGAGEFGGNVQPSTDDTYDLGTASLRWDDVYATNSTIQTSDENQKRDIEELNDAERRVALRAKSLMRKYRFISSYDEKGDDARIHFGLIAQDLIAAFEAEGLDPWRYGVLIKSVWWERFEDFEEQVGKDKDGNPIYAFVEKKVIYEEEPEGDAERMERLGVRYTELLALIIAAV